MADAMVGISYSKMDLCKSGHGLGKLNVGVALYGWFGPLYRFIQ